MVRGQRGLDSGLMAMHHRVGRLETRTAAGRACPLYNTGPAVVRILPPLAVSRVDEVAWVTEEPGDYCPRCRRRVVHRIPPPVVARAGT